MKKEVTFSVEVEYDTLAEYYRALASLAEVVARETNAEPKIVENHALNLVHNHQPGCRCTGLARGGVVAGGGTVVMNGGDTFLAADEAKRIQDRQAGS